MKPQTFMNESGSEVLQKANYFKIKPKDIWVICDDINLPLGQMRIKEEGSSGGHKGLQSIIDKLKTEDFPRIRVGIGLPEPKIPAEDYVLQNFSALEKKEIDKTIDQVAEIIVKLENNKWICARRAKIIVRLSARKDAAIKNLKLKTQMLKLQDKTKKLEIINFFTLCFMLQFSVLPFEF